MASLPQANEVESGKRNDRPALAAVLRLCRRHKATLVIAKLDRLARNVAFNSNLMESGVKFVAVDMHEAEAISKRRSRRQGLAVLDWEGVASLRHSGGAQRSERHHSAWRTLTAGTPTPTRGRSRDEILILSMEAAKNIRNAIRYGNSRNRPEFLALVSIIPR